MSPGVVITSFETVTAYGRGADILWGSLLDGRSAVRAPRRECEARFEVAPVAQCSLIAPKSPETVVWQMCRILLDHPFLKDIPGGTELYLSSTVGEIELLERAVAQGSDASGSCLSNLCLKVERQLGLAPGHGTIISAACASGTMALAIASNRIRRGLTPSALIMAVDVVSEFVLAGFSSLMALDKLGARPFDRSRAGLSLGDGAAFMLLTSLDYAHRNGLPVLAEVVGWGRSDDANHITGPSRDGSGLADAIQGAIKMAGISTREVAFISAHGTGTLYNDAMEMKALKNVFSDPVAIYGVKGAIGHTLGAAGLIETGVAVQALQRSCIPPTVGLSEPDPEALGWVSSGSRTIAGDYALCVNAGFGGINAAICLKRQD